mmetsp:Transcript_87064/g.198709  ORF Transcript_87064/g.198709 Transcript_87064/m.198709 type:complete len:234 (+) Transcript_87064:1463-2164(+)
MWWGSGLRVSNWDTMLRGSLVAASSSSCLDSAVSCSRSSGLDHPTLASRAAKLLSRASTMLWSSQDWVCASAPRRLTISCLKGSSKTRRATHTSSSPAGEETDRGQNNNAFRFPQGTVTNPEINRGRRRGTMPLEAKTFHLLAITQVLSTEVQRTGSTGTAASASLHVTVPLTPLQRPASKVILKLASGFFAIQPLVPTTPMRTSTKAVEVTLGSLALKTRTTHSSGHSLVKA